jgi:hypothetical protein
MKSALALLVAVGCWTGRSAPATNEPNAHAESPIVVKAKAEPPSQPPGDVAHELSNQLRTSAERLLPAMVNGPIVVFDLDSAKLTTLCGLAAAREAQTWARLMIDTNRAEPLCIAGPNQTFTCVQVNPPNMIMVELEDPKQWRIKSVLLGDPSSDRNIMRTGLDQLRNAVSTATCP